MKPSYYLIAAVGLAAVAVGVYPKLGKRAPDPVPSLPVPADPPATDTGAEPPLAPTASLPAIPTPPDTPLAISEGATPASAWVSPPPLPAPPPGSPPILLTPSPTPNEPPTPLPTPAGLVVPQPELPTLPVPPAGPRTLDLPPPGMPPVIPAVPPSPGAPAAPAVQPVPVVPSLNPGVPETPQIAPPPIAVLPKPAPLPVPVPSNPMLPTPPSTLPSTENPPPEALAVAGKFAVLKGNKLTEGTVTVVGEKVLIRQGAIDRVVPKIEVLFVGETRDEVYRFMLARVGASDASARLAVAQWCMFSGLREQALAETQEVLKLQPTNRTAADMARSLEESLKQFPADGSTPVPSKPRGGTIETLEPEPDVTAEGATSFVTRAQPVLANLCMECHAQQNYPGALKLTRITGYEAGPQSTKANLRAVAGQLRKDDPLSSPLLVKSLTAHGNMKQPPFANRNVPGYKALEAWVALAVGPAVQPMPAPVQPVLPQSPPVATTPPMPTPMAPMLPPPVLPPVETPPMIPPAGTVQPFPTTPAIPPSAPVVPPVIPPAAESGPKIPPAPPVIPIPPAVSLPKPPGEVLPAGGTSSQFGTAIPPKPPVTTPTTKGDEFDPEAFNKGK